MKICRFNDNQLGVVQGEHILDVTEALNELPGYRYPAPRFDALISELSNLMPTIKSVAQSANPVPVDSVTLLSPVANPTKLVCAPVNYQKHIDESKEDQEIHNNQHLDAIRRVALFLKASSALVGPGEGIKLRNLDKRNDHEVELALVIGRTADRVTEDEAFDYVAGYTIGLDMTTRGPEDRSFRKSIDSYAVLGPWLTTADEIEDPTNLDIELSVNDVVKQKANTRDLLVKIPELIAWASSFYTLHPGDVIFTGTPEGVGPVVPGDLISATIEGIGSMQVSVGTA